MPEWVKVYDLAEDTERIRASQEATLTSDFFGLVPEVALFGSDEWWEAIEDGRIPRHEVVGRISRVYLSGHGDWPEFEIDSSGVKSSWTRMGPDGCYKEGYEAKVEYVLQKAKKNWDSRTVKVVIHIYVRAS